MSKVTVERIVNAPIDAVWSSWDAFGDIKKFNPNLRGSHLLAGSAETGLGAERQCDFADGKNYVRERIIGYRPERQLVVDIYEGTVPLKTATGTFDFQSLGPSKTRVAMRMEFEPKMALSAS